MRLLHILLIQNDKEQIPSDVVRVSLVCIVGDHVIASDGPRKPHNAVTLSYYPSHTDISTSYKHHFTTD